MSDHKKIYNNDDVKGWTHLLETLRQENTLLKIRLSNVLQYPVSRSFTDEAELYQQRFIKKDQVIDLLLHDTFSLSQSLQNVADARQETTRQADLLLMDKDLHRFNMEFKQLKDIFDEWVSREPQQPFS